MTATLVVDESYTNYADLYYAAVAEVHTFGSDPLDKDTDDDGLEDYNETATHNTSHRINQEHLQNHYLPEHWRTWWIFPY